MSEDIEPISDDKQFRPDGDIDHALEKEIADALGGKSLAEIMDSEGPPLTARHITADGQRLYKSQVIDIHGDDIFVDLGGKSQGLLSTSQFGDDDLPGVGDDVEFLITSRHSDDGLVLLSREGAVAAATWESLEFGQTVEGTVTGHNKGGLELKINGIRGFMPLSQIEQFGGVEDVAGYVNRKLTCQVIEANPRDKKLVVSRRAHLDAEAAQKRGELFETLAKGDTVSGVVKTIMPYGAFVDIGGTDGLVHVRELGHGHVANPADVVEVGQQVEVVVLEIDREKEKISLSLRQALPDPWHDVAERFPADTIVTGRVVTLMDFGAFVELAEGLEGLIPISEMTFGRRISHPKELVQVGEEVRVRVLNVEPDRKRISLSLKRAGDDPWIGASARWAAQSVAEGVVTRIADFGAFVQLAEGVEGLVHISELSDRRVNKVGDVVSEGDTVQVRVLEVDEDAWRMSLSIKQVHASPSFSGRGDGYTSRSSASPAKDKKHNRPLKGGLD